MREIGERERRDRIERVRERENEREGGREGGRDGERMREGERERYAVSSLCLEMQQRISV